LALEDAVHLLEQLVTGLQDTSVQESFGHIFLQTDQSVLWGMHEKLRFHVQNEALTQSGLVSVVSHGVDVLGLVSTPDLLQHEKVQKEMQKLHFLMYDLPMRRAKIWAAAWHADLLHSSLEK